MEFSSGKYCRSCGKSKPLCEFHAKKSSSDGKRSICKTCRVSEQKEYRENNREKAKENYARWRERNPAKIAEYYERYKSRHADRIRKSIYEYEQRNPDKKRAHRVLNDAVRYGFIQKPTTCEVCDSEVLSIDLHAHHENYADPLAVQWLCRNCHNARHRHARHRQNEKRAW